MRASNLPLGRRLLSASVANFGITLHGEFEYCQSRRGEIAEERSGSSTMTEHPRISLAPDVLAGKPVIRGTRLSVEFVIGLMADGWSEADILGNYPGVTRDDLIACLAYARDTLSSEKVFPSAA